VLSTGLAAVERIDAALQLRLARQGAAGARGGAARAFDPMAGLAFESIPLAADPPPAEGEKTTTFRAAAFLQRSGAESSPIEQLRAQMKSPAREETSETEPPAAAHDPEAVLAGIRETQRQLERFDQLGAKLAGGLSKLM